MTIVKCYRCKQIKEVKNESKMRYCPKCQIFTANLYFDEGKSNNLNAKEEIMAEKEENKEETKTEKKVPISKQIKKLLQDKVSKEDIAKQLNVKVGYINAVEKKK